MRIVNATVEVVDLSLWLPFRTALRATQSVADIRLAITTDTGLTGFGSAVGTPAITGETTESIVTAIQAYILPALQSIELEDQPLVWQRLQGAIVGNAAAKAAVDIALHDIAAKQQGTPLCAALRQPCRSITTDATVSLAAPAAMAEQAALWLQRGFAVLKVKLGGRDGLDVQRIAQIRQTTGTHVTIRVDANQAWTPQEAITCAEQLEKYGVELIEQPVAAHDIKGLRAVTERSSIPIAADESVYDHTDLSRILDEQAAHIVNIKLMKAGGITEARQMIEAVEAANLAWMVGSMMEGPISVTAAAHLAAAYGCKYVDLDAGYFLADTKADGGVAYDGPTITLPQQAGLGIAPMVGTGVENR